MVCSIGVARPRVPIAALIMVSGVFVASGFLRLSFGGEATPSVLRAPEPDGDDNRSAKSPRLDRWGDPLPDYALDRLASLRFRLPTDGLLDVIATQDETQLIALCGQSICIWNTSSGILVRRVALDKGFVPRRFAMSRDGKRLAVIDQARTDGKNTICLYQSETLASLGVLRPESGGPEFDADGEFGFSHDDKTLIAVGEGGVATWDIQTRRVTYRPSDNVLLSYCAEIDALAEWGGRSKGIEVMPHNGGKAIAKVSTPENCFAVKHAKFSPTGRHLAVIWLYERIVGVGANALREQYAILNVLDVKADKVVCHERVVPRRTTFSRNGKWLSAHANDGVHFWNLDAPSNPPIVAVCPYPYVILKDGKEAISTGLDELWRYAVPSGKILSPVNLYSPRIGYCFAPDGKRFVERPGRSVWLAELGKESPVWKVSSAEGLEGGEPRFTPSGDTIVDVYREGVHYRDSASGKVKSLVPFPEIDRTFPSYVGRAPNGDKFALVYERSMHLVDAKTKSNVFKYPSRPDGSLGIAFSPDGNTFATYKNSVCLWSTAAAAPPAVLLGKRRLVDSVVYSPTGHHVFVVSENDDESHMQVLEIESATGSVVARFEREFAGKAADGIFPLQGGRFAIVSAMDVDRDGQHRWAVYGLDTVCRRVVSHAGLPEVLATIPNTNWLLVREPDSGVPLIAAAPPVPFANRAAKSSADVASIWKRLASDAESAHQAIDDISRLDVAGLAALRKLLEESTWPDPRDLPALVKAVRTSDAAGRRAARDKLAPFGIAATSELRKALTGQLSLTARDEIMARLAELGSPLVTDAEELRHVRAVHGLYLNPHSESVDLLRWIQSRPAKTRSVASAQVAVFEREQQAKLNR